MLCLYTIRFVTLCDVTRDQREQRQNMNCTNMELSGLRRVAGFQSLPMRWSETESKHLKTECDNYWNQPTCQRVQLNSYSNVLYSGWAPSARTSGRNICSLNDWKTAASSEAVGCGLTLLTASHVALCLSHPPPVSRPLSRSVKGMQFASYSC